MCNIIMPNIATRWLIKNLAIHSVSASLIIITRYMFAFNGTFYAVK